MLTIFLYQALGVMASRIGIISLSTKGPQTLYQVLYLVLGSSFLEGNVSKSFLGLLESFSSDSLAHLKPNLGVLAHNFFCLIVSNFFLLEL